MIRRFVFALVFFVSTGAVLAQEAEDFMAANTSFYDTRNKGVVNGCYIQFKSVFRDYIYLEGGLMATSGSVGFMAAKNDLVYILKASAKIVSSDKGEVVENPMDIEYGYFAAGNFSSAGREADMQICSDQTSICGVYSDGAEDAAGSLVSEDHFSVFMTPKDGSMDIGVKVPINWDADKQTPLPDPLTSTQLYTCLQTMIDNLIGEQ